MGSSCSRCSCGKKEKDHYRCVIVGLDGAGKTTLFNYICDKNQGEKQPISGFEICSREYDKIIFDFWDTNGDACCRQFWTHYIFGAHAIIFVVDSTNRERFPEVKAELIKLLNCEGTENLLWLIVASKLDVPGHVFEREILDSLNLDQLLGERHWRLFAEEKSKPPINDYLKYLASSFIN